LPPDVSTQSRVTESTQRGMCELKITLSEYLRKIANASIKPGRQSSAVAVMTEDGMEVTKATSDMPAVENSIHVLIIAGTRLD